VLQNLGLNWFPNWHYAVVKGIDIASNEIILHSGTTENYVTSLRTFERTWQRADKWAMVVLPADRVPASADALSYLKTVSYFENQGELDVVQAYQTAIVRWPTEVVLLVALGNVYYQRRQVADARSMYEKAVNVDGEYAPARNNLAQVLLESGELEDARIHAQIAVQSGGIHASQYQQTLQQIEQEQARQGGK